MNHVDPFASSSSSPPALDTLPDVLAGLSRIGSLVVRSGKGWVAQCPAHDDKHQSLSLNEGTRGQAFILKCHAGCSFEQVMAELRSQLGLAPASTEPVPVSPSTPGKIVVTYDYTDARGTLVAQVVRLEPKSFRQRHVSDDGTLVWGLPPEVPRYLYRLADLSKRFRKAEQGTVFVAEGEKDVDMLWELKLPATTNIGGAGKWRPEYTEQLKAAYVTQAVILPDNDEAGRKHAAQVAAALHGANIAVKVVALPGLPEKGDVSDYLAAHPKAEMFEAVKAAPAWSPPDVETEVVEPTERPNVIVLEDHELYPGPDDDVVDPIIYHWDGFVVEGDVVTVLGAKKALKTWLVDYLAVSASNASPLFDGMPSGNQRVALIVGPGENRVHETRRRIRAIRKQHGITASSGGAIKVFTYTTAALRLDRQSPETYNQLCEALAAFRPTMLGLETTGALWGGKEENNTPEVREWLTERLRPLIQSCASPCTTYLQAHVPKPTRWQNKVVKRRDQRGASGWGEAVDTTLYVDGQEAPEGEAISLVDQDFTRSGESTKRVLRFHLSGGPRSGKPVTVAVAWHEDERDAPNTGSEGAVQAVQAAVVLLHQAGATGMFRQALIDTLVAQKHTVTGARGAERVVRGQEPWPCGPDRWKARSVVAEEKMGKASAIHLTYTGPAPAEYLGEMPPF